MMELAIWWCNLVFSHSSRILCGLSVIGRKGISRAAIRTVQPSHWDLNFFSLMGLILKIGQGGD